MNKNWERKLWKLLLLSLLVPFTLPATPVKVQLTGNLGSLSGSLVSVASACLNLPVNAIDTSAGNAVAPGPVCFTLSNGAFPSFARVIPNDVIKPDNTYYHMTVFDVTGAPVFNANYVIPTGGGTFNIGTAVPTSITTSNISYSAPAVLNTNSTQIFLGLIEFFQTPQFIQPCCVNPPFLVISTAPVGNLNASPTTYNAFGTQQINQHFVRDTATFTAGTVTVSFGPTSAYSNAASYSCWVSRSATFNGYTVTYSTGTSVIFTSSNLADTDTFSFLCMGN